MPENRPHSWLAQGEAFKYLPSPICAVVIDQNKLKNVFVVMLKQPLDERLHIHLFIVTWHDNRNRIIQCFMLYHAHCWSWGIARRALCANKYRTGQESYPRDVL